MQNTWDNAEDGPNGGKLCPTCGVTVKNAPNSGKSRDWDVSHNPSWSNRSFNSNTTRQSVIENYQKGVSLECPSCNRSGGNNDSRFKK
ncbi:GH-E family nuclease [Acetobacter indonesiensis]|uniref:GH-E family nuclease n=1 Tax=Acetobacter indonesiensis TaxID=104101 RepID=UPI00353073ED